MTSNAAKELVHTISDSHGEALTAYLAEHGTTVRNRVIAAGAALLRGFAWTDWADLRTAVGHVAGEALDYTERSSPRTELRRGVYTATDHPPAEEIYLHNEQSYNLRVPRLLFFFCKRSAPKGGATVLADCHRVYDLLPAGLRDRFDEEGYLLVRNYRPGLGVSWQDAFGTHDRDQVAEYCRAHEIEHEWISDNHLRTRQLRWAVATHPDSGRRSWFNHLTFFHITTLRDDLRDYLLDEFGPWGVPSNTFYADGTELDPLTLRELRSGYRMSRVDIACADGDIVIVDNLSVAHGRAPFVPPRELFFSMGDAVSWSALRPGNAPSAPQPPGAGQAVAE